jgi:hypothetical protein
VSCLGRQPTHLGRWLEDCFCMLQNLGSPFLVKFISWARRGFTSYCAGVYTRWG